MRPNYANHAAAEPPSAKASLRDTAPLANRRRGEKCGLRALRDLLDDADPPWSEVTRMLAEAYQGRCGLLFHDAATPQLGTVLNGYPDDEDYISRYELIAGFNPWVPLMMEKEAGTFIYGKEAIDRASIDWRFYEWMNRLNLFHGLGAVLFNARGTSSLPFPVVAISLVRPMQTGEYSPAEVEEFKSFIPALVEAIGKHKDIERWRRIHEGPGKYIDRHSDNYGVTFLRLLKIKDIIIQRLLENGFSPEDALKAHGLVEGALSASRLRIVPEEATPAVMPASVPGQAPAEAPDIPSNWKEAKHRAPKLKTFVKARQANPQLTIIDHLRDPEGLGRWTTREPGLPRSALFEIDPTAHKGLYNWLGRTDPNTKRRNELPVDLHLPRRSDLARRDVTATPDEAREARRKASLLHRMISQGGPPKR